MVRGATKKGESRQQQRTTCRIRTREKNLSKKKNTSIFLICPSKRSKLPINSYLTGDVESRKALAITLSGGTQGTTERAQRAVR